MKRITILVCLFGMLGFSFSACNKTENKALPQAEIEEKQLPEFKDYIEAFVQNDTEAIRKLNNGEISTCNTVTELLQYYLQDKDEETCIRIVKLALDNKGKMVDGLDISGPLIESCKLNYYKLTEYLLKNGAKKYINHNASQYGPALFWAMLNGNIELVELLLENGADPNGDTAYSPNYIVEIDDFIENNKISPETGNKIKSLLIQYGYKEQVESN